MTGHKDTENREFLMVFSLLPAQRVCNSNSSRGQSLNHEKEYLQIGKTRPVYWKENKMQAGYMTPEADSFNS
jgi:hypothetical protein